MKTWNTILRIYLLYLLVKITQSNIGHIFFLKEEEKKNILKQKLTKLNFSGYYHLDLKANFSHVRT